MREQSFRLYSQQKLALQLECQVSKKRKINTNLWATGSSFPQEGERRITAHCFKAVIENLPSLSALIGASLNGSFEARGVIWLVVATC